MMYGRCRVGHVANGDTRSVETGNHVRMRWAQQHTGFPVIRPTVFGIPVRFPPNRIHSRLNLGFVVVAGIARVQGCKTREHISQQKRASFFARTGKAFSHA